MSEFVKMTENRKSNQLKPKDVLFAKQMKHCADNTAVYLLTASRKTTEGLTNKKEIHQ